MIHPDYPVTRISNTYDLTQEDLDRYGIQDLDDLQDVWEQFKAFQRRDGTDDHEDELRLLQDEERIEEIRYHEMEYWAAEQERISDKELNNLIEFERMRSSGRDTAEMER
ncbi:MAG: hypothetical protein JSS76_16295 [Bacteroidetes bacterium]|nr:hypothetical protein [Bacteroidota bacterium]